MKRVALALSLLVCVALVGSALLADDAPKGEGDKPVVKDGQKVKTEGAKEGVVGKEGEAKKDGPRLGDLGNKMDKVVGGFSSEQKGQIAELNKAREAAIKEANDKFLAAVQALMSDEQKAKWQEATKEGAKKEGQPKEGKGDLKKEGVKEGGDRPAKTGAPKEGKVPGEGDAAK